MAFSNTIIDSTYNKLLLLNLFLQISQFLLHFLSQLHLLNVALVHVIATKTIISSKYSFLKIKSLFVYMYYK